ncbi:MAG: HEAT repeat domain-containing protein, partial [Planctomycetes bacterium]|nr:HEAT repeat domain-containing protein [Planctomycetota bacterium]
MFIRKRFNLFSVLASAVLTILPAFLTACGEKESFDRRAPSVEPLPEGEWFWFERLARRPIPLPLEEPSPDLVRKVETLLEPLKGLDPPRARDAVAELTACGSSIIPVLLPHLKSEDRCVRWAVVSTLGRLRDPRCLEPLLSVFREPWDAAAIMSVSFCSRIAEPWIIPRLIKAIGPYPVDFNPHLVLRIKAAGLLIKLGNFSAVPFLLKVLKGNTPLADPENEWDQTPRLAWAKEEALAILKKLTGNDFGFHIDASGPKQAEGARQFESWWIDHQEKIWLEAPALDDPQLKGIIDQIIQGLGAFQARNVDGARYILKMLGPPVFPFLAETIRSGTFYERFHALEILADLAPLAFSDSKRWAGAVAGALKDQAPAVRMKAAFTLGM